MKRLILLAMLFGAAAMGVFLASHGLAEPRPAERRADSEKMLALLKERRDTLKQIADESERDHREGSMSTVIVAKAMIEWLHAELDLAADRAARIAVHEQLVTYLRKAEAAVKRDMTTLKKDPKAPDPSKSKHHEHSENYEFLIIRAARCRAEIDLLREQEQSD